MKAITPVLIGLGLIAWVGSVAPVDAQNNAKRAPVTPQTLWKLIESADEIVVMESRASNAPVLFKPTDRKDLLEFKECLTIKRPDDEFNCACLGSPFIRISAGAKELVNISGHHRISIRCSLWSSDALITDEKKYLAWFDKRGSRNPEMRSKKCKNGLLNRTTIWSDGSPHCLAR